MNPASDPDSGAGPEAAPAAAAAAAPATVTVTAPDSAPPGLHRAPGTRPNRRRHHIDWELIACGWAGHVMVGLDAAEVGEEDDLLVRERGDLRWHRCLRCDCWVALPPPERAERQRPPRRAEIEVPLRGRALRDRVVLRVIAVDRVIHFLILGLLGIAVLLFAAHRTSLRDTFYRVLTALQGGVGGGPVQTTGHVGIVHELDRLFTLRTGTLTAVGIALLAYAVMEGVEAVGLWLGKRWAEYLTFIATAVLLPFEVYEIIDKGTATKVIGFLINLAVVVYLLFKKRLFGLRGGGRAEAQECAREMSWERIEQATPAGLPAPGGITLPS